MPRHNQILVTKLESLRDMRGTIREHVDQKGNAKKKYLAKGEYADTHAPIEELRPQPEPEPGQ